MKKLLNGILVELTEEEINMTPSQISILKQEKISQININSMEAVEVNSITFNGGDGSASAISGAVTLAQKLGESEVKLWDVNNIVRSFTFEEALNIAAQVAKSYRDKKFAKYELIEQINNATTVAELEAIDV